MGKFQTKKGRIEIIGEDKVTILNLDGYCRDTLAITPGEAVYIRGKIGFGEEVFYSVKDGKLIQVGLDKAVPELRYLYEEFPKEMECLSAV